MRKFSALLLTGLLFISLLAGCGGGQTDVSSSLPDTTVNSTTTSSAAPETDETTTTATEDTTTTTQDKTEPSAADKTTADKTDKSTTTTTGKTDKPTTTTTKKSTTTRKTTTSKPTTKKPTTTQSQTPAEPLEILCWGDSLTQGAYMKSDADEYPSILQSMIGDGYKVWNGGFGGDSSYSIMARQGSVKLTTKDAITFAAGVSTVTIGHRENGMGLLRDDGAELTKMNVQMATLSKSPMDIKINPVTIGGKTYKLGISFEGYTQKVDGKYYITLTRDDSNSALTIPAGTAVTLTNTDKSKNSYCDIFLMGANDTIQDDPAKIDALIDRYKKAIAYHGNDNYIVIIPFGSAAYDAPFKAAFGDKALPFRELAIEKGLETEGITPSKADTDPRFEGKVPASLHYRKNPNDIHLNEKGYHFLAKCVYDKGVELGYWK